jgi:hypothetical protein
MMENPDMHEIALWYRPLDRFMYLRRQRRYIRHELLHRRSLSRRSLLLFCSDARHIEYS